MERIVFFNSPNIQTLISHATNVLMQDPEKVKHYQLGKVLKFITLNSEQFDRFCQLHIKWNHERLERLLYPFKPDDNVIDSIIVMIYYMLVEYNISIKDDLPLELREFLGNVEGNKFQMPDSKRHEITLARQEIPIAILKEILNSDEFGSLRNVSVFANKIDTKIHQWQNRLDASETTALNLAETLVKHTNEFNFVGLHEGFNDLSKVMKKELSVAQIGISFFGLLTLIPSGINLWAIFMKGFDFSKIPMLTLIATLVGTITMTLLFLYFFRIALRKADSCRAQLVQVRLRMSLCQFIQSYADYSTEIKGKNPDALAKFEALIFSGIVGNEDKLPSTFDGIEQLSKLAKSLRGE